MGAAHRLLMPQFRPPDASRRAAAVGDTSNPNEEPQFKSYLEHGMEHTEFFRPIPVPGAQDWLANHPEPGQKFDEWFTLLGKNDVQFGPRRVIYVLPILKTNPSRQENPSQFLQLLKQYAEAFFVGLDVMVLPRVSSTELGCKTRVHEVVPGVKREQMLAPDILTYLQRDMPYDAYCVIGVTMIDLYPRDSWNFVFGMASLVRRSGIFSFARYHPNFLGDKDVNDTMESILELPVKRLRLGVRRSFEIFTHEVSHMFGIQHCIYYACLMNGSNHQQESDSRPIFLCPVCLRKLKHAINFDTAKRYEGMLQVFRSIDERFPLPKEEKSKATEKQEQAPEKAEGEQSTSLKEGEKPASEKEEESSVVKGDEGPSVEKEGEEPASMESTTEDTEGEKKLPRKDEDKITECVQWLAMTTEYLATVTP